MLTREQVQANLERYKRFHDEAVYCGDDMSQLAEALSQAWDALEKCEPIIAKVVEYVGYAGSTDALKSLRQALEVRE